MKNLLKPKVLIILAVIAVIILCTVSYFLGVHSGKASSERSAADKATDTPAVTDAPDTVTPSPEATPVPEVTVQPTVTVMPETTPVAAAEGIVYHNTQFGFDFKLNDSWEGYQVLSDVWEGTSIDGANQGDITETGVKIIIRHPGWSDKKPYQDIPIMIFTYDQWEKVENEDISLGAAPIGPTWLGSNSQYVFALPARYNFDFALGTQQVDKMINNGAFTANEYYIK